MVANDRIGAGPPEAHSSLKRDRVVVSAHQPNYIPWLGYFYKISQADKFVFLDVVPAPKGGFVNRNCVKTVNGAAWLTVPILTSGRFGQPIKDIETDNGTGWRHKHLMTLHTNYHRAPYFRDVFDLLEPIYNGISGDTSLLADFNIRLIRTISYFLGFNPEWLRASALPTAGHKTDLVVSLCVSAGATVYLAGTGAKAYQEDAAFARAGITSMYSPFSLHPYPQRFGEFIPNLSIVDVLMNCGYEGTRRILEMSSGDSKQRLA